MAASTGVEKRAREPGELEQLLQEQLRFIQASADAFDSGFEAEAKRLAVSIRVLVHESRTSKSLLGQLGALPNFRNTALPVKPENELTHSGLIWVAHGLPRGMYKAMLDDVPIQEDLPFEEWWGQPVFRDNQQRVLSRKDLVLTASNQDGGAHVDPKLNDAYAALSRDNSLGWTYVSEGHSGPLGGAESVAIRQIAHEVLKSLVAGYEKKPNLEGVGMISGGVSVVQHAAPPLPPAVRPSPVPKVDFERKVGRNETCPCGSGKKYKKCHGG